MRERERVREEESSSSGKREDGENKAMSIIFLFLFFCYTKSREAWCGVEPKRLGVCTMSFNDVPFTIPLENLFYIYIYIFFFLGQRKILSNITSSFFCLRNWFLLKFSKKQLYFIFKDSIKHKRMG